MEQIKTKKCQYCGKKMKSLYPAQLNYNVRAHEISCPENPESDKGKVK